MSFTFLLPHKAEVAKIFKYQGCSQGRTTAVTRGHFDAWSTDQEFPIVILIWQTRFTEIAVSRKL